MIFHQDKFEELKNEEEPSKGPTDFEPKEENEEKKVDPPQGELERFERRPEEISLFMYL